MKSKAHMKKCLELGVSMTSVDDAETEEAGMSKWFNLVGMVSFQLKYGKYGVCKWLIALQHSDGHGKIHDEYLEYFLIES